MIVAPKRIFDFPSHEVQCEFEVEIGILYDEYYVKERIPQWFRKQGEIMHKEANAAPKKPKAPKAKKPVAKIKRFR